MGDPIVQGTPVCCKQLLWQSKWMGRTPGALVVDHSGIFEICTRNAWDPCIQKFRTPTGGDSRVCCIAPFNPGTDLAIPIDMA